LKYSVFISHGWHDKWIAKQMARLIAEAGGEPFIDIFDVRIGDRIEERVREGTRDCDELIALLTPWSVDRNWVWTEIAAAWAHGKRFAGIAYGVTPEAIEKNHGGLACLGPTNIVALDEFEHYISQLSERIQSEAKR